MAAVSDRVKDPRCENQEELLENSSKILEKAGVLLSNSSTNSPETAKIIAKTSKEMSDLLLSLALGSQGKETLIINHKPRLIFQGTLKTLQTI